MFLKNKNIIFKSRRSKVTDYAALIVFSIRYVWYEGEDLARVCSFHMVNGRGVTCLKFNVRNCGDVVNAFMKIKSKREHLQIA